jgi:hypothetical protein
VTRQQVLPLLCWSAAITSTGNVQQEFILFSYLLAYDGGIKSIFQELCQNTGMERRTRQYTIVEKE